MNSETSSEKQTGSTFISRNEELDLFDGDLGRSQGLQGSRNDPFTHSCDSNPSHFHLSDIDRFGLIKQSTALVGSRNEENINEGGEIGLKESTWKMAQVKSINSVPGEEEKDARELHKQAVKEIETLKKTIEELSMEKNDLVKKLAEKDELYQIIEKENQLLRKENSQLKSMSVDISLKHQPKSRGDEETKEDELSKHFPSGIKSIARELSAPENDLSLSLDSDRDRIFLKDDKLDGNKFSMNLATSPSFDGISSVANKSIILYEQLEGNVKKMDPNEDFVMKVMADFEANLIVENPGDLIWPKDTEIWCEDYASGEETKLIGELAGGEARKIQLELTAPNTPGIFEYVWKLRCKNRKTRKYETFGNEFLLRISVKPKNG
mmetsp:Transcript_40792/g.47449  ORF Transcript_40792/g.47449 Transcript_40792/m.47449 type:complete len:380 (+) Transcript_40792:36-1175(+)|eukprot:CAMPEP_0176429114 /NCGR_PEP_ID=MMETSP0127-20121128/13530_1 /TAXON_ID=938130 /ORGANISM="Platyophrya macrostoma, Strain WH" /LENGTH=379 /DNA_ID=CAMNT_0017810881 /DNA_START=28 /DNA_END=1167 /DNA_ORIENTATION=-